MFIDTTVPELAGFDPSKSGGLALPPVGNYPDILLQVIASEQGETEKGLGKFDITYEILTGELTKTQFKLTYNTGHTNHDTAKWAIQDVLRVVYAITGMKDLGRVNFDEKLHFRPFIATLNITNQTATDSQGNPYRQGKLVGLKPEKDVNGTVNKPAAHVANNATAQPQQATAGSKPSWAS